MAETKTPCNGFDYDVYALYALGLAEDPESEQLFSHLKHHCETCLKSLADALEFWYIFAHLMDRDGNGKVLGPRPELRIRILNITRPVSAGRSWVPAWSRERIAAGAFIMVGTGVTAWQVGRLSSVTQLREARLQVNLQHDLAETLNRENLALRSQPPPAAAVPPVLPLPTDTAPALAALQRQLEESRSLEATADQTLAGVRARIGELQLDVAEKTSQLESATHGREEAERRLRDAERVLAQTQDKSAQQEASIASFRSQVRDLEGQIVQYRETIQTQQRNLAQHLQLASLLQSPSLKLVQLLATEAGPNASGVAVIANNSSLAFYASNLPVLPDRRVYQLWLVRSRGPAIASAGVFSTSGRDLPTLQLRDPKLLASVTALAVTEEPAGGSPTPTGHKLLIGTPR